MYADRMTQSIQRAIEETNRRRAKQVAFNTAHAITPRGVSKRVKDIIEGVYDPTATHQQLKAEQSAAAYKAMSEGDLAREIKRLEKDMLEHARNLEFEQAAQARDRLRELKDRLFGVAQRDAVTDLEAAPVAAPGKAAKRAGGRRQRSW
jgi:excinuclease ABC subunit B